MQQPCTHRVSPFTFRVADAPPCRPADIGVEQRRALTVIILWLA
jgi:hypothetical protein